VPAALRAILFSDVECRKSGRTPQEIANSPWQTTQFIP